MRTIEVGKKSVSRLLDEMAQTGFQGKKLGEVAKIWTEMTSRKGLTIFMGLTGSLSTTGQWKIVRWLIEKRYVDVLVSTGANISEDLLEAIGYGYYQGTWLANDEELLRLKIDRFYDVYADEYEYRKLEDLILKFASGLDDKLVYSTREFLWLFGEYQSKKGIRSITAAAYERKVPVYSPGLIDSGYGVALSLLKRKGKLIRLDQTKDNDPSCHGHQVTREGRGGGDTPRLRDPDNRRQPAVGRPLGLHPRGGGQLGEGGPRCEEGDSVLRHHVGPSHHCSRDQRASAEEGRPTGPGVGLQGLARPPALLGPTGGPPPSRSPLRGLMRTRGIHLSSPRTSPGLKTSRFEPLS